MSTCQGFMSTDRELRPLYISVYIFSIVVSWEFLHTVKWYQVFLSNTNNLHTVVWFQVSVSNTNNYTVASNYFYLIIVICLHTWFQVTNNNNNP